MSNIHTNIHTAGPWLLRKNVSGHWAIANGGWGKQFAGVKHAEQGYTSEELAANARLMTAAPDLLAAAELMVENCNHGRNPSVPRKQQPQNERERETQ